MTPDDPLRRPRPPLRSPLQSRPEIIAIGASTGGPRVLHDILTHLPATFPVPLLVVQHISEGFVGGLVEWLASQCALSVQVATAGLPLDRPGVHVAPFDRHLEVQGRCISLNDEPPVSGHRPSATALFRSVAREYGAAAVGILLTGMGTDGAAGLRDLKQAGAATIAQDHDTSAVFGMPSSAIDAGVVDYVMSPGEIVELLLHLVSGARSRAERGR